MKFPKMKFVRVSKRSRGRSRFYCGCQEKMALMRSSLSQQADYLNQVSFAEDVLEYDFDLLHQPESWAIYSPDIPFKRELAEPLTFKSDIIFSGRVKKKAIRFAINFGLKDSDIGFHLNPRFDQNYVARNHFIEGEWGVEEGHSFKKNPLKRGAEFTIEIFITTLSYMVCINGRHFCEFHHRVPVTDIKRLCVEGDVELNQILLSTKDCYPNIQPPLTVLPLECEVYSQLSLEVGEGVEVYGRVKLLPQVWFLNLEGGAGVVWPHPNIPLHISVRYSPRDRIVFNSWCDTGWGSEQCVALPAELSPGSRFKLTLSYAPWFFLVSVNGAPLYRFKHRLDPKSVNMLYIRGDLVVDKISTLSPPPNKEFMLNV